MGNNEKENEVVMAKTNFVDTSMFMVMVHNILDSMVSVDIVSNMGTNRPTVGPKKETKKEQSNFAQNVED